MDEVHQPNPVTPLEDYWDLAKLAQLFRALE